jgi:phosphatidylserine/phosphatidylglycerophosphate/cardiolipin synthase-like enzyme
VQRRRGPERDARAEISARAYTLASEAWSWEEIWEAGNYYRRISDLLEGAREHAVFTGWQVDSRLPFPDPRARAGGPALETLKQKILRLVEAKPGFHFYFLMWDHAYFYTLERETMQGRIWDNLHPRVHFVFDNRHPYGASHHEKIAVIDGKVAFCGGIDLCDERWDSPSHLLHDPRRSLDWRREKHGPYHDLAVQVTGPVCGEILRHVGRRWRQLSSVPFPEPARGRTAVRGGGHRVLLSRTLVSPEDPIVRDVEFLFRDLLRTARRRILLEGQYWWSRRVNEWLIEAMRRRGPGLEVLIVLADLGKLKALSSQMSAHELGLVAELQAVARETGARLHVGAPFAYGGPEDPPRPVYVHSKVMVVDDRYLMIGSANFAERALRLDTELALTWVAETPAERAQIERVGRQIEDHWNAVPARRRPGRHIQLRPIDGAVQLAELRRRHPWSSRVPWRRFFDPDLPWTYPLKRRFRHLVATGSGLVTFAVFGVWFAGVAGAMLLGGVLPAETPTEHWGQAYSLFLASGWLMPLPFVALALLSALHLGPAVGAWITVSSFWCAAVIGYTVCRIFPSTAGRYFRRTGPRWLPARIGLRSFPYLVSVIADPRVSIRSKIAYQGLYTIPMPWFALGTLLVLGSALHAAAWAVGTWASPAVRGWFVGHAPWLLPALIVLGLIQLAIRPRPKR